MAKSNTESKYSPPKNLFEEPLENEELALAEGSWLVPGILSVVALAAILARAIGHDRLPRPQEVADGIFEPLLDFRPKSGRRLTWILRVHNRLRSAATR